jgi:NAD(P)H-dependent flavin oxidoreductase YrpB (nitropropane dioxygenase family)
MNTLTTPLCAPPGIEVPVAHASIGSATPPALAAAVREAGGLGTLALTWGSARGLAAMTLSAGRPAVLASEPRPAARIVATIAREAAGVLGRAAGTAVSCR